MSDVEANPSPPGGCHDESIVWQVDVKPGEFVEVAFVARNPRSGEKIVWTLRQRFADGTVSDWTNGPNGIRPMAVTQLTPAATK